MRLGRASQALGLVYPARASAFTLRAAGETLRVYARLTGAFRGLGTKPGESSFAEDPVATELSLFHFRDGFCPGRKLHFRGGSAAHTGCAAHGGKP